MPVLHLGQGAISSLAFGIASCAGNPFFCICPGTSSSSFWINLPMVARKTSADPSPLPIFFKYVSHFAVIDGLDNKFPSIDWHRIRPFSVIETIFLETEIYSCRLIVSMIPLLVASVPNPSLSLRVSLSSPSPTIFRKFSSWQSIGLLYKALAALSCLLLYQLCFSPVPVPSVRAKTVPPLLLWQEGKALSTLFRVRFCRL